MNSVGIGGGILLIVFGVACFCYGTMMPEDKQVGCLGTYYDSTAFIIRGALISIGGLIILVFALFT